LRLDPKSAESYTNLGNAYYRKKQYDQALINYNEALRVNPQYSIGYQNRGMVYEVLGRKDEAIADYRNALLLAPNQKQTEEALKRLGALP
jgi:tetratricopeptide (TPR) repeat protein